MILLQGKNLTKYYGVDKVFEDISFVIKEGAKVGLVGPNGAGKTTLFKGLVGQETFDRGEVTIGNKYTLGYLEQIPKYPQGTLLMDSVLEMFADIFAIRDVLRALEKEMGQVSGAKLEKIMDKYSQLTQEYEDLDGFGCEAKARRIIKGLGFNDKDFQRDVNFFSGGEKTRVSLARLLVREPNLLLLDEPNNHLDLNALEWLEGYLKDYLGAVLVISHDRYFLDQVVNEILHLEHHTLTSFSGNYSRYLELKEEQELAQHRAYLKQSEEIKRTEEYIRKYKAGIKSKQARGRQKQLDRLERMEDVKGSLAINLNFKAVGTTGEIVIDVKDLAMNYDDGEVFSEVSFTLYKGDKVGLVGLNGTGKSTILKILTNKIIPTQGAVNLGARVKVGYFDQQHGDLNGNYKVIEELMFTFNFNEGEARNYLALVLFRGDDVFKKIGDLSGGERGRLALLKLILEEPNLLIMDEPTNHLDIPSKEVMEDLLREFPGTLLVVSHDRYFLDRITEKTLELEQGRIKEYLGNYTYYRTKKAELERQLKIEEKVQVKEEKKKPDKPKVNKSKVKEEIKALELAIEELELRIGELSELLADPESYQDEERSKGLINEYKEGEARLPMLYSQWENLLKVLEG